MLIINIEVSDYIRMTIPAEEVYTEIELLDEFGDVVTYLISVYKLRYESIIGHKLSDIEEFDLTLKMNEAIVFVPVDEIRDFISMEE